MYSHEMVMSPLSETLLFTTSKEDLHVCMACVCVCVLCKVHEVIDYVLLYECMRVCVCVCVYVGGLQWTIQYMYNVCCPDWICVMCILKDRYNEDPVIYAYGFKV